MSEYQFYEFAAIDRPLTSREMEKLRAVSTRGIITPYSFTNHYHWGALKADPQDWMKRYFDAHVYLADWGQCTFSLKLPKSSFSKEDIDPFKNRASLFATSTNTHWIIDWLASDEPFDDDRYAEDDGTGWLQRLIPIRDELMAGDMRSLYLGWLAAGHSMKKFVLEPELPPGMKEMSPAQKALAKFLEIDPDLIEAAAVNSARIPTQTRTDTHDMNVWLDGWTVPDMHNILQLLVTDQSQKAISMARNRYLTWLRQQRPMVSSYTSRRTVGELRELAKSASAARLAREEQERRQHETRQRQKRHAELRRMMNNENRYWKNADQEASRGCASGYDQALRILSELSEGNALVSSPEVFRKKLRHFLAVHGKRPALVRRLKDAGLPVD